MSDQLKREGVTFRKGYVATFQAHNKDGKDKFFSVQVRGNKEYKNKDLILVVTKLMTKLGAVLHAFDDRETWSPTMFPNRYLDRFISPEVINIKTNLFSRRKMRTALAAIESDFMLDVSGKIDTHTYSIWHKPGADHVGDLPKGHFGLFNVKKVIKRLSSLYGTPTHTFEDTKVNVIDDELWSSFDGDMIFKVPGLDKPFMAQLRCYDKEWGMIKGLALVVAGDTMEIITGVENVKNGFEYLGEINKGFLMTHILGSEDQQKLGENESNRRAKLGPAMVNSTTGLSNEDMTRMIEATASMSAKNFENAILSGRILEILYGERSPEERPLTGNQDWLMRREARDTLFAILHWLEIPVASVESLMLAQSRTIELWKDGELSGYCPEQGRWSKQTPSSAIKSFGIDLPESGIHVGFSLELFVRYYPDAISILEANGIEWCSERRLPYTTWKHGRNYLHAIDTDTLDGVFKRVSLFSQEFKRVMFPNFGGPDLDGDTYAKCRAGKTTCVIDRDGKLGNDAAEPFLSVGPKSSVMFFRFPIGAGEFARISAFNVRLKFNRLKGRNGREPLLPLLTAKPFTPVELVAEPRAYDGKLWSNAASQEVSDLIETQSVFGSKVDANALEILQSNGRADQFGSELFVDTYQQLLGTKEMLEEADQYEAGMRKRAEKSLTRVQNLRYGVVSRDDGELLPDGDDIFSHSMQEKGRIYSSYRADLVEKLLSPIGLLTNRAKAIRSLADKSDRVKDALDFVQDYIPDEVTDSSWNNAVAHLQKEVNKEKNIHLRILRYWCFVSEFGLFATEQNPDWAEERATTWLNDTKLLALRSTSKFEYMTTEHPVIKALMWAFDVKAEEVLQEVVEAGEAVWMTPLDDDDHEPMYRLDDDDYELVDLSLMDDDDHEPVNPGLYLDDNEGGPPVSFMDDDGSAPPNQMGED